MKGHTRMLRAISGAALTCLTGLAVSDPAAAQDWPQRAITIIVPLGAGSASDVMARVVADQLSRQLGQPVLVENKVGAGGTIGAGLVAKAAPDGYTVLAYGALGTAHALYSKLPYDTLNDFIPVTSFGMQPQALVVSPAKGYSALPDLVAKAKAKPGEMNFSSAGVGSASHFAAERLRMAAGFEAQHIPFRGSGDSLKEIVAGRVDFSLQTFVTTLPLIREGTLQALAVSAHKRVSALPNAPTLVEAGLSSDAVYPFYSGVFLPAKTPRSIVEKLHQETSKALQAPLVQERLTTLGVAPMPMTLEEFARFFRDDVAGSVKLVKDAKIATQ